MGRMTTVQHKQTAPTTVDALWQQVQKLDLSDQLALGDRVYANISPVPDSLLPSTPEELKQEIGEALAEADAHPELCLTAEEAIRTIRAELAR